MRRLLMLLCVLLLCVCVSLWLASAQDQPPLDLHSIPISDWLNAGDHTGIPWDFAVRDAYLRVDQRLEVLYMGNIDAKELNKTGPQHELFLISRVSSSDGEWLNDTSVMHQDIEEQLARHVQVQFAMRMVVQPGDYMLWVVLYDRKTGKYNVAKRHFKVPELRGDPLPDLYRRMPLVEFPESSDDRNAPGYINGLLYLPVRNRRPLQVQLISMLSPPEQWTGRSRILRTHNDDTVGALAALSQMELTDGTISITGLDLVRRQVLFDQRDFKRVRWNSLMDAIKKAQSPNISASALEGSKNNAAFFREFLDKRLTSDPVQSDAMRVIIVVTSSRLFESGSDLRPLQIEGDCHCRVYFLRFRLNVNDVFDELEKLIKPLHPHVFNLLNARDLRKALAEIVDDLGKI
jgi:hypothetical protein